MASFSIEKMNVIPARVNYKPIEQDLTEAWETVTSLFEDLLKSLHAEVSQTKKKRKFHLQRQSSLRKRRKKMYQRFKSQ